MRRHLLLLYAVFFSIPLQAQLKLDTAFTPKELVEDVLLGERVEVANVRIKGRAMSYCKFDDVSDRPLIGEGIMFTTGHIEDALGPNDRPNSGLHRGGRGNAELSKIATYPTYDASGIEFDFIPEYEWFQFNFVFASEEYVEYVNSRYNDVFAFFISGPGFPKATNLAVIPGTRKPITINTVNHGLNKEFYIDNNVFGRAGMPMKTLPETVDSVWINTFAFDGLTKPITIGAKVKPGEKYHIAIYIADVSDGAFDSAVFLEGKSFTSLPIDLEQRKVILAQEASNFRRAFSPAIIGESVPQELKTTGDPDEGNDIVEVEDPDGGNDGTGSKEEPGGTTYFNEDPNSEGGIPVTESPGEDGNKGNTTSTRTVDFDWKLLVTFAYDSDELNWKAEQQLEEGLMYIREHPGMKLRVRGHTCDMGNKSYNQRLSKKRAESVAAYLSKAGIDGSLIITEAWDYQLPRIANETEESRAQNRRVEVSFAPLGK